MSDSVSFQGRNFITKEEGRLLKPYKDPVGYWTIGVGHLITKQERSSGKIIINGDPVKWTDGLLAEEVDALLAQDLHSFESDVYDSLRFEPEQNQLDALVSLAFNIGTGAFRKSTLLKRLNNDSELDEDRLKPWWLAWKNAGGKPILLKRRQREWALFWSGDYGS